MRKNLIRTSTLAAMAVAAVLSLTACQGGSDSTGAAQSANQGQNTGSKVGSSGTKDVSAEAEKGKSTDGATSGNDSSASSRSGTSSNGAAAQSSGSGSSGDKRGYGQTCGANDLKWSATSETQAGGYILIAVKARPGITCTLPSALPMVAFGSDGTEAGPAEQSVGNQVKLSGATTAYAGVNPKTTNTNGGKELNEIITAVSQDDHTDPVSLPTGSITVDRPIVTNWHTSPQDAVPGSGLDSD
ncbi:MULTISPECIES: DUF4232 domain-containing protein [unclassified Streptomyces]|uniref:DUF4232 domain-containing protein n=1 Tax=unclassified Streptomyces TaxID=2593676 RepID=UPI002E244333|nr:DUF4232 domain-containing protein [Streptomyces sp. NBC_01023]